MGAFWLGMRDCRAVLQLCSRAVLRFFGRNYFFPRPKMRNSFSAAGASVSLAPTSLAFVTTVTSWKLALAS